MLKAFRGWCSGTILEPNCPSDEVDGAKMVFLRVAHCCYFY